jgi:hypothetical protein
MDEWYRGRQRALNILAAIDDASPSINTKQGQSGEALHTVLPKGADNLLQPKRTCGVKEDILQPCNQPALSVFLADQLVHENKVGVETGAPQVTLQTTGPVQTPTDILDAERALSVFDYSVMWGPNSSVTRFERLARRRKYAPTDGWEWVDDILCQFPELGHLKAHERIEDDASCKIARPTQNNVQTVRGSRKCLTTPAGAAVWKSVLLEPVKPSIQPRIPPL